MAQVTYNYSHVFKYIIIGDMGVGKSCILHQLIESKFISDSAHTIGVEFGTSIVDVNGEKIKLQIWDTAGQERFRSVTKSYYRGAVGVIIVYDISSRSSFDHLNSWLTDARNLTAANTVIILLGNKCDREAHRNVTYEEGEKFAKENGLLFHETSAKSGANVSDSFYVVTHKIYEGIRDGSITVDSNRGANAQRANIDATQNGNIAHGRSGCC